MTENDESDRDDSMSRGELMEGVGRKASQLLQILPVPSTWRTENKFPAEPSGEAKGCLMGCFGLLVVLIVAAIIGLFVLLAILGGGADSPESTTESPDVATAVTTATAAADDLALIEGPWRIRNEELSLGGLTAPFVVVERGTFTDAGDGRLVGTSGSGDTAIGFDLVSSSPSERVYTTTFMGAVYTLRFDAPGHFVGDVVLDGVLERRIEGWSEFDESGAPRTGLPEVGEAELTTDADQRSGDGTADVIGSIAATCGVDWLPVDLALPGTTFEPLSAPNGGVACAGDYVDDGFGTAQSVLAVEAGRLGLEFREESRSLVVLGCADGVGPIRFELTDWGETTQILASVDPRLCSDVFG